MSDASASTEFDLLLDAVRTALAGRDSPRLVALAEPLHPSDIADLVQALDDEEVQLAFLRGLSTEAASEALAEMDEGELRADLLAALAPSKSAELVHQLADDDAADLISELEPAERAAILAELSAEEAEDLEELLQYDEESAGGRMTTALVSIPSEMTAAAAIGEVRVQSREVGDFYSVFVVDAGGRLMGTLSLGDLISADPAETVESLVSPPVAVVMPEDDQEEVGRLLSRYNLVSVPVVDSNNVLLGRVTFDDVIDVLEAEQTEDILRLAGVRDGEVVRGGWFDAVRVRLPWLALNLVTATLAALVILHYEELIAQFIALAFLAPIIAAMGGNAGTQSLAITLRRLTLGEGEMGERPWRAVGKEVIVGLINGAALGLLASVIGYKVSGTPEMGLVVGLAMWGNLAVAGFAGAFVPTLLDRIGVDPAVASSVFVHTMTDLVGFFLLLGIASSILI